MATITPLIRKSQSILADGTQVIQFYGTSASNSADSFTTPTCKQGSWKLLNVGVHYSGAATYTATALTIGIDSGISSSFDQGLFAGSSNNAQDVVYLPDPDIRLIQGDAIVCALPAGGSGVFGNVVVTVLAS